MTKYLVYEGLGLVANGITNGSITLRICSNSLADEVVVEHHYSHKATQNRFLSMSVNHNKGILQLGYGIRPRMKHTICDKITQDNFCEFDRMWLSDELPFNSESQVISLLLSYLKQTRRHIKFVITYADESAGNKGTIYKATNAISLGSVPCDFYLLPTGERVHPVSMYHRHGTRAIATLRSLYPDIKHIKGGYRQFRFLYILDKRLRREFERENSND